MSDALDLLAGFVLEDGRRWGEVAAGFQLEDARAVLDRESSTPYSFLTRARGGSKTSDLAAVAVAVMLEQAPPGSRLYGLAADRDQGRLLIDSIHGFAARTPELSGALTIEAYKAVATRSGSVLEVLAADAPGAWGLRPYFVVVDELAQWGATLGPRRLWEAVTSAIAKVAGCRLVVLTTAGDPAHWSHGVLEHALSDAMWRANQVAGPPPWANPERLAEQRRRLPESIYRRLFENEWTAAEDRLVSPDDLAACVTLDGPLPAEPGRKYVIGLDLGLRRDRTAAAVCHSEPILSDDGEGRGVRVVLDRLHVWQGKGRGDEVQADEIEAWIEWAAGHYNRATVVFDPAIGGAIVAQRLRKVGIRMDEWTFSPATNSKLAFTLHDLLRRRALALPDDEELIDELGNVRLRETSPNVFRLDHDSSRHDDRAIALALSAHQLVEHGSRPRGFGTAKVVHFPPKTTNPFAYGDSHLSGTPEKPLTEQEARKRFPWYRDPRFD